MFGYPLRAAEEQVESCGFLHGVLLGEPLGFAEAFVPLGQFFEDQLVVGVGKRAGHQRASLRLAAGYRATSARRYRTRRLYFTNGIPVRRYLSCASAASVVWITGANSRAVAMAGSVDKSMPVSMNSLDNSVSV